MNNLNYELVPPSPPKLSVSLEETDSLHLKWIDTVEPDTPISGKYHRLNTKKTGFII
jgi:hypothetical protein